MAKGGQPGAGTLPLRTAAATLGRGLTHSHSPGSRRRQEGGPKRRASRRCRAQQRGTATRLQHTNRSTTTHQ
eukprot:scaffold262917_cov30-Tisochrysis_lutea.AAC.3